MQYMVKICHILLTLVVTWLWPELSAFHCFNVLFFFFKQLYFRFSHVSSIHSSWVKVSCQYFRKFVLWSLSLLLLISNHIVPKGCHCGRLWCLNRASCPGSFILIAALCHWLDKVDPHGSTHLSRSKWSPSNSYRLIPSPGSPWRWMWSWDIPL